MKKINSKILDDLNSSNRQVFENAFNIIYKEYSYLVYYISLKIIKDSSEALAITNEVFYQFFINRKNINKTKNIKYYLVTISKNISLNYIKKHSNVVELLDIYSYNPKYNNSFDEYINKFKDFLNEEEIDIIVMHFLYDFSFKEIALEKKQTTNAISSKYRRCILKIREHYSEVSELWKNWNI